MKPFPYTLNPEQIPTRKLMDITHEDGPHVRYACPRSCWREHFDAWCRERRNGNKTAPVPESSGHCMFERPAEYGMVPYGCTDQTMIRAAWERHVRALLHGWDRDLTADQLDQIVNATVDAKPCGEETGAAPFLACIMVSAFK